MATDVDNAPGRIKLAAATRPALDNGVYTVKVTQTLDGDAKLNSSKVKSVEYSFDCSAEPHKLAPEAVYSVYPPKDSYGDFERVIPHIVLRRRTYPWERPGPGGNNETPWIALILFDETEDARLLTPSQEEPFTNDSCYCPAGAENPDDGCTVLEIDAGLFSAICPSLEELPLLAHSRGVCRDNKVTERDFVDEWLSVIVSNRLPASAPSDNGLKNTACLVSVENFGEYFSDPHVFSKAPYVSAESKAHVYIPVLTHWSFYSHTEDFNFKQLFEGLDAGVLSPSDITDKTDMPEEVVNLLERGFVPLNHQLRDGSRTVSWYHGPLLPCSSQRSQRSAAYFSDSRMIYQEDLGMFDISYSAAFQLGRMLGLQSGSFSQALQRWRRENLRQASAVVCTEMIGAKLGFDTRGPNGCVDLRMHLDGLAARILSKNGMRSEESSG